MEELYLLNLQTRFPK